MIAMAKDTRRRFARVLGTPERTGSFPLQHGHSSDQATLEPQ